MLVGRTAELDRIDHLVGDLVGGRGGALWLSGAPGAGVTTLLDAAARRAARRGAAVVRMRAVASDPVVPLALVVDLLRVLDRDGSRSSGPSDATSALVAALLARTAERPLLLLLDDLTDADDASRAAVLAALARLADRPLAIVAGGSSIPSGRAEPPWPRLDVPELSVEAARAVVRSALGPEAADGTVIALTDRLGGNPLALVEVARALVAEPASWSGGLPDLLPVGSRLRAAWDPVVEAWPVGTRQAVACLALVGRGTPGLLGRLLAAEGLTPADLEPAESDGVLGCPSVAGPVLAHPVAGLVVLSRLAPAERRRLHGLVAHSAAELGADPGVVVEHLLASVNLPDGATAAELDHQADRARELGLLGLAARTLEAAARMTEDPDVRTSRALRAVRAWVESGNDPATGTPLLSLVAMNRVPAAESDWVAWLQATVEPNAATYLERTRAVITDLRGPCPGVRKGLLWEAAVAAWAIGDPDAAMVAVTEYLEVPHVDGTERVDLPWTGLALQAAGLIQLGRVAEGVRARQLALEQADALDTTSVDLLMLLDAVFLDDLLLADGPGSEHRIEAALERTSAPGHDPVPSLVGIRAWRARGRGDWEVAARIRDEGLAASGADAVPFVTCGLLALSVELAALQGDRDRLRSDGEALHHLGHRLSDRRRLGVLERARGMDALVRGELEVAESHLGAAGDVGFLGRGLRDCVLASRVDLVEVLARSGDLAGARARCDALVPLLDALDQPLASAWAARVRAAVAEGGDVDVWFDRALTAHARVRDPFEEGRTELLLGEHLRRTRRRAEARRHLARAAALFDQVGARPWRDRAAQELRVAGSSAAQSGHGVDRLTPQERNVAAAAAAGRSTREVAELLVLSPRTVETHLSSVYRKLGLRGRAGLGAALAAGHDDV